MTQPGQPDPPAPVPTRTSGDNLVPAVVMFALFPPFALPATIDARRARLAYRAGELGVAADAAHESRRWTRAALVAGLIAWGLLLCCGGGGLALRAIGLFG